MCVMLAYLAAGLMYDERIARGSAALMMVSPFFLMLSSVHLSHTSTVFFFLLFLYFFLKGLEGARWFHFLLAGLALGAMALTRPLTAAAASIPWAAYTLWLVFRRRIHPANAGALAFGVAVGVALLLAYNSALTGDPFTSGYSVFYGDNFRLGFVQPPHELVFARHRHTPLRGVVNVNNGLFYLNKYLFGWPLPSLLFAMVPFALPSRNKWDHLMLASLLSIPAVYFFFFHQDFMMGPRYYFSFIPAAVILSARGLRDIPELWSRLAGPKGGGEGAPRFLAILIFVGIVFNLALFFPDRLRYYGISSPVHQGVPAPVWRHVESEKVGNAVVFINDFPYSLAYGTGLWRNDPALEGDIVYARDQGLGNGLLMERYPGRRYYRYEAVTDSFAEVFPFGQPAGEPAPSPQ
jgi:4-amino-4-deoxy-L-arabinose transferase-like glycosyltransferase